jgi:hypothetical protein
MLRACETKRDEMLKWPKFHLAMLARQIRNDWSRLESFFADPESVTVLEALQLSMPPTTTAQPNWLTSDHAAIRQFLESAQRFNRHWQAYIDGLDLELVNKPRRDFNQFYVLEKSCLFGNERVTEGFEPLGMIERSYLYERFPLLSLPSLA